jgi:hypothetical protein
MFKKYPLPLKIIQPITCISLFKYSSVFIVLCKELNRKLMESIKMEEHENNNNTFFSGKQV